MIRVLESNEWYSGTSKTVERFERKLRDYLNCKHVVAVNSGTAALHLALSLFKPQVMTTTAHSFVSTAQAIVMNGHTIKFKDQGPYNVPVHFGGMPSDISEAIVEDCAHAMGSKLKGDNIKCFSFHAQKNLAMPNGGAIALYDDEHLEELKAKRWCGIRQGETRDVVSEGYNYVMNNVSAVCGIEQLRTLDENNDRRRAIAKRYYEELDFVRMPYDKDCSYHLYWIRVKNRDEFRAKMLENGIETGFHYPSIDRFSAFDDEFLPRTHILSELIVTLPIHPNLKSEDLDRVIKSANSSV